ncbi:MAG: 2Fe-2S ferredoxin [Firmicutes bacterium HGW-Firmicutes-8]|nr:MAG: 2Fe-2S ferredoxin [Firmicutes bacterium HGW-Firmicutes-8]
MNNPKYHIFVCGSFRSNGRQKGFCHSKASLEIMETFLEEVEERGLSGKVLVTNTGCLGICEKGPIVIIYPDNVWYGSVKPGDVEEIMDLHIEGGKEVERLKL